MHVNLVFRATGQSQDPDCYSTVDIDGAEYQLLVDTTANLCFRCLSGPGGTVATDIIWIGEGDTFEQSFTLTTGVHSSHDLVIRSDGYLVLQNPGRYIRVGRIYFVLSCQIMPTVFQGPLLLYSQS